MAKDSREQEEVESRSPLKKKATTTAAERFSGNDFFSLSRNFSHKNKITKI
jgi:hypothetical protein